MERSTLDLTLFATAALEKGGGRKMSQPLQNRSQSKNQIGK